MKRLTRWILGLSGGALLAFGTVVYWSMNHSTALSSVQLTPAKQLTLENEKSEALHPLEQQTSDSQKIEQADLDQRLEYLFGIKGDGKYSTREAALLLLNDHLSDDQVKLLIDFVVGKASLKGLAPLEAAAIKNDVMNLLRNQTVHPAGLQNALIRISSDLQQPAVMRDYALQHLSLWYRNDLTSEEQAPVLQALWQGAAGNQGSIPGTSLLALDRLLPTNDSKDRTLLANTALQIIQNPQSDIAANVTALQVCAHLHQQDAEPVALQLAQSSNTPMPVRISAIAALGDLGDASIEGQLQEWAQSSEPRLSIPAQSALQRMNQRLGL